MIDGHLRARLELADSSQLKPAGYMYGSPTGEIMVITYCAHWADIDNQVIKHWNHTPHFPDLPGFPEHLHDGATGLVTTG